MHSEPTLQISLLGKLEINRDGVLLTDFKHRKTLALLAYLVVAGDKLQP